MAASMMATAPILSYSYSGGGGRGVLSGGVKVPSTLRVSRPMEIAHVHWKSPVVIRMRTCRVSASWAEEGPPGLIEEAQTPLAQHELGGENGEGSEESKDDSEEGEIEAESEGQSGQESESYEQNYPPPIPEGTKLYVGNLPLDVDSQRLASIFGEAGVVEMAEVICYKDTDRSRGFAFVTMSTVQEAEAAIQKFNGFEIDGSALRVNFPEVPRVAGRARKRNIDSPHKVYVGNLAWSVTSEALRSAFEGKASVLGARVVYDRETGRSRGFGFVNFSSEAELEAVLTTMDGVELEGRPMRVNVAQTRPRPYVKPMQTE